MTKTKRKSTKPQKLNYDVIAEDFEPQSIKKIKPFKFTPKNPKQKKAWEVMKENSVTFLLGKVGSGKTFLAVAHAVEMLKRKEVDKIVLLRPATVNKLEAIGYLKGSMDDKVKPLVLPMQSIFEELLGKELVEAYMQRGIIQPYAIAYVEGMTYKNSIVLLDEYQNTSDEMLRAVLTRIDDSSQCIVMGDKAQIKLDDPSISASLKVDRFKNKRGIGFIEFETHEIVRGKITELIEECYEDNDSINFDIKPKEITKHKEYKINAVKVEDSLVDDDIVEIVNGMVSADSDPLTSFEHIVWVNP